MKTLKKVVAFSCFYQLSVSLIRFLCVLVVYSMSYNTIVIRAVEHAVLKTFFSGKLGGSMTNQLGKRVGNRGSDHLHEGANLSHQCGR